MRIIIVLFVMFNFCVNPAQAYDFRKITDDSRIVSALSVLEETGSTEALDRVFTKDKNNKYTQIMFYDLGMISFEYKKHFAMTSTDNFGENYILINTKYKNAPKEALAALIAHESSHRLDKADLNEEIVATVNEVKQWNKSLANNPELGANSDDLLLKRLNNLSKIYNEDGVKAINRQIADNPFYQSELRL